MLEGWRGLAGVRGVGMVVAGALAFSIVMAVRPLSASAVLPGVDVSHMTEIEEWVYRGAPKDPMPCGQVCTELWNSEHGTLPETAATREFWEKLGELYTVKTHLWGTMEEFRRALEGIFNLGAPPFRVGWHIGNGEGSKWMEVVGPTAPSGSLPCGWRGIFMTPGLELQSSFFEKAFSPGNEWYLIGCNNSEIMAEYAFAENPNKPGENCNDNGFGFIVEGWTKQEWLWNRCEEGIGFYAPIFAEAFYEQFHFGRVEDWTGQSLTGELTRNIQTVGQSDPGLTAVREAIERALEESPAFGKWVQWVVEGQVGGDPLGALPQEGYGDANASAPNAKTCLMGKPVNCATGNEVLAQTDLRVGGRGLGLRMTRTYNAQLAAEQGSPGVFGYGWTGSYSSRVLFSEEQKRATVYQDDGSTVGFTRSGEQWVAANPLVQATLATEASGYIYTLPDQTVLHFNASGLLTSEVDRNGNALTMNRNAEGRLESVSDPAGRKLVFAYNGEGLVESVTDPMGHVTKYAYEAKNLTAVTLPGETAANWRFKYDSQHRLTSITDGRGGKTTTEYDSQNRVVLQTDPLGRVLKFEYEPSRTKITNQATGAVTDEHYSVDNELVSITHGYGTSNATTSEFTYDKAGDLASASDGNKHVIGYEYDGSGNRIKMVTPEGRETKWTYDGTHDVMSQTRPNGEKTTIVRDEHGNATLISRPAPGASVQETRFEYDAHGQLVSMTDPLGRKSTYEYDNQGDRTSETDPEGDKRTWAYNEDSQETATVSPRGNVTGGEPSKYTTSIERDAQGRPVKITDPLGHIIRYSYDPDGNRVSETDPNGHETKTEYDADNEPVKVTLPNGALRETGYDGAGQLTSQTDGDKHTTTYTRNVLEQVREITDPLLHKTIKVYDLAGNLASITDPSKRTTSFTYNKDDQPVKITYSDGVTPTVEYEYDKDGNRTSMIDGSGKTTYAYDQLDRLTKTVDGHGNTLSYEYDLANQQTKITYPNTKTVEHTYDKAGRMATVKDWLGNTTSFGYDQDFNLTTTTLPSATSETDHYTYNEADQQTEAKMSKGTETLASLLYTRDNNGQLTKTVTKGLPGSETVETGYDANERLTKAASTTYEYDAANNPTKLGTSTNTFNADSQLTEATGFKYTYDEQGERTKTTPTTGAATTYTYNQAGDLTSITRPRESKTPELKDTYTYNGDGLRTSQTISGTTTYLTSDHSTPIPLILNDTTNNYLYGPNSTQIEQINNKEEPTYLHHDQAGSTRLLTSSTGTVTGAYTYTPYGATEAHTGTATTPLGYDGQLTSSDTGLIYLRARTYDPSTAQFMSVDPAVGITRAPYNYAEDNPINKADPTGLGNWLGLGISSPGEALFPGGGSGQACIGGTVSIGAVTIGGEACYVHTPNGEGIALTPSVTAGPGFGVNIHAGAGESNACHASEYGGLFSQASGSASAGFTGGYYNRFSSQPFSAGGRPVEGWTAGAAVGLNAEAGVGGSYTFTIPFGSGGESGSLGCGC